MSREPKQVPVAVIGVSALFPGSTDAEGFYRDIVAAKDLITDVPETHWLAEDYYDPDPSAPDKTYCKRGGFLPKTAFDPLEFGVPPSVVPATDAAQLLALVMAKRALEDAAQGAAISTLSRERASVILGVTSAQELLAGLVSRLQRPVWLKALRESGVPEPEAQAICDRIAANYTPWQEASFPGLLGNVVAGRIANRFDLRGTNCVTDAACASTLSALAMALNELSLGQSDLVLTGGVDTMNGIFMYTCFSKTPALSRTGECKPFDESSDGTLLGEGMAMFVLKRLQDAERDGDRIYGVIRGIGSSSDGRSTSVYAPLPGGQARALTRAYEAAGYGPDTVELVEAHGTGTRAGDAAELEALRSVFESSGLRHRPWCAIGSVKSQIGHTKAAAGAAGIFKALMALHHKTLPPTIKITRPNAALADEATPFYVMTEARPWAHEPSTPRRASVSSFGFGGSNFHVTLEEYVPRAGSNATAAWRYRTRPTELVLLSARDADELAALCAEAAREVKNLAAFARRSSETFDPKAEARLAVVAKDVSDLAEKLAQAADRLRKDASPFVTPNGLSFGTGPALGDVAFVFPGQGSQYLGMGRDLALAFGAARLPWDEAATFRFDGVGLDEVAFPRTRFTEAEREKVATRLTATEWAQPCIGLVSASQLALLSALGLRPSCVAGHSFGEIPALFAAGALRFADMVEVARRRGEIMRDAAAAPGAMLAVAKSATEIAAMLDGANDGVVVANDNAPDQVVLSGAVSAIERAERKLESAKVAVRRLRVSTAFHSPIVASSSAVFRPWLDGTALYEPTLDVFSTAHAAPYPKAPEAMRDVLAEQIARPVRFVEQIEAMYARGARVFVEVGPSDVLTGLVKRILGDRPHVAVALDRKDKHGVTTLQEALGRLAAAGIAFDTAPLWAAHAPVAERPAKAPALTLELTGTSYGKPYPPPGGARALPPPNPPRGPAPPAVATPPAPVTPAAAASFVPNGGGHEAWARAFQAAHHQTADAHAAYQRAMAESHMAFLRAAEASFAGVASLFGGAPPPPMPASMPMPMPVSAPMAVVNPPAPAFAPPPRPHAEPLPASVAPPVASPTNGTHDAAKPSPATESVDPADLLLQVVADKTGYPVEMLRLDMELEGDLGIDSIKRVEILSAMRDRAPGLAAVAPSDLGALRSLGQIVQYLQKGKTSGARPGGGKEPDAAGVPEVEPPAARAPARTTMQHLEVRAVAEAPPGLTPPWLRTGRVALVDDGGVVAPALLRALGERGIVAEVVGEAPADASAVVLLAGLRAVTGPDDATAIAREAFGVARAISRRFAKEGGLFVTVQDTGGDFGLAGTDGARAWLGGLAGLARTAAREWPAATVRAIDCERGDRSVTEIAEALADELVEGGSARDVGLRADGTRLGLRLDAAERTAAAPSLGPSSVVVVSGGARGVTAASLVELARASRPRFVLLGRTPLEPEAADLRDAGDEAALRAALLRRAGREGRAITPLELAAEASRVLAAREVRSTLDTLAGVGSEARYVAVDVEDAAAVSAALDDVRASWGPITAIVHAAGVLADKAIAEKTDAQFERVYSTKVAGFASLLEATQNDPLELVCAFSSVAAHAGNAGQADYAMANATLETVACAERVHRPNAVVRAIGWGPWEGGMVTPALRAHFQARGVPLIPLAEGARVFVEEIAPSRRGVVSLVAATHSGASAQAAVSLGVDAPKAQKWAVHVSARSHAYLEDHAISGTVVLPVAMVVEWFARAAHAAGAAKGLRAVRKLEVVRGVKLVHFRGEGDLLVVHARPYTNGAGEDLALELRGLDDVLHYRAVSGPAMAPGSISEVRLEPWHESALYDGRTLFHGRALQVIRHVEGFGEAGATAILAGARAMGWGSGLHWRTDPALVDGALQVAVLWSRRVLGGATLPMAVGAYECHAEGLCDEAVRCVVRAKEARGSRAVCDVHLVTTAGRPVATLSRVETILRPDEAGIAAGEGARG